LAKWSPQASENRAASGAFLAVVVGYRRNKSNSQQVFGKTRISRSLSWAVLYVGAKKRLQPCMSFP